MKCFLSSKLCVDFLKVLRCWGFMLLSGRMLLLLGLAVINLGTPLSQALAASLSEVLYFSESESLQLEFFAEVLSEAGVSEEDLTAFLFSESLSGEEKQAFLEDLTSLTLEHGVSEQDILSLLEDRALGEADHVLYLQNLLNTNSEVLVAEGKTRKELEDGCAKGFISIKICYGYKIDSRFWKWRVEGKIEWSCDYFCVKKEPDMTPKEPKPEPRPEPEPEPEVQTPEPEIDLDFREPEPEPELDLDTPKEPYVPTIVYGETLSETS